MTGLPALLPGPRRRRPYGRCLVLGAAALGLIGISWWYARDETRYWQRIFEQLAVQCPDGHPADLTGWIPEGLKRSTDPLSWVRAAEAEPWVRRSASLCEDVVLNGLIQTVLVESYPPNDRAAERVALRQSFNAFIARASNPASLRALVTAQTMEMLVELRHQR